MKQYGKTILIASLVFCTGGWMVALGDWSLAELTPERVGGLLMSLAAVVAASVGDSIIKPKE
jgi:hypothetical protein